MAAVRMVFTKHALEVLDKRNISNKLVEHSINLPDFRIAVEGGRFILLKKFGGKFLKIVVANKQDEIVIITGHWLALKRAERLINEN